MKTEVVLKSQHAKERYAERMFNENRSCIEILYT